MLLRFHEHAPAKIRIDCRRRTEKTRIFTLLCNSYFQISRNCRFLRGRIVAIIIASYGVFSHILAREKRYFIPHDEFNRLLRHTRGHTYDRTKTHIHPCNVRSREFREFGAVFRISLRKIPGTRTRFSELIAKEKLTNMDARRSLWCV